MKTVISCPEEHELLAVLTGESVGESVRAHLYDCSECNLRLERLRDEVSAIRVMRRILSPWAWPRPVMTGKLHRKMDGQPRRASRSSNSLQRRRRPSLFPRRAAMTAQTGISARWKRMSHQRLGSIWSWGGFRSRARPKCSASFIPSCVETLC